MGVAPRIVTGHDYRSYSLSIKQALTLGLLEAGLEVHDIGLALSPIAYFAQFDLDIPCVAMVTASHNENGWTGVKMGANKPLTFGPEEMGRLKDIVLNGKFNPQPGGKLIRVDGMRERYIADVTKGIKLSRKLKVVCACGNGAAGAFAPDALRAMGAEVIEMDTNLDYNFPKYNPNPEDHEMLVSMGKAVIEHGADLCVGFDGDGDRCGVVDNHGEEIFADKIGVMLARDLSAACIPNATIRRRREIHGPVRHRSGELQKLGVTDRLLEDRPLLHQAPGSTDLNALAGFEKSGHFFFRKPYGYGYDDALVAAAAVLQMLDRNPGRSLSDLKSDLGDAWTSLTMSPHCDDEKKYAIVDQVVADYTALGKSGGEILGRKIIDVNTVNGARVTLDDGSWVLVRASSNKPELVVVVESMQGEDDMRALFREEVKPRLGKFAEVGHYNQEI
jgi:phosphomannomutase/phosphoglucomutase